MAAGTFHGVAIQRVIREALESAHGALRAIPSGTYSQGTLGADQGHTDTLRAISGPRIEASILEAKVSPSSPLEPGSIRIWDVTVQVRVVRAISREHMLSSSARDTVRGLAASDGPVIANALGYPGNYRHTSTGTAATGIVSGRLKHAGSSIGLIEPSADGARLVTTHRFTCMVVDTVWLPYDLTPQLWLRADLGVTVTAGTQTVTAWADQSPTGAVTVVSAASRVYESTALGLREGLVCTAGTTSAAAVTPAAATCADVILVFGNLGSSSGERNLFSDGNAGPGAAGWALTHEYVSTTATTGYLYVEDALGATVSRTVAATGLPADGVRVVRWTLDASNATLAVNGTSSTTSHSLAASWSNQAAYIMSAVGSYGATTATVAEAFVRFGSTGLSAAQLTAYREYVNARYGTSLSSI